MLASYEATNLRYHILDTNAKNTQIFLLLAEIKKNLETILKKTCWNYLCMSYLVYHLFYLWYEVALYHTIENVPSNNNNRWPWKKIIFRDFSRSVNPFSTSGDRLLPPNFFWHPRILRPFDGPVGPRWRQIL